MNLDELSTEINNKEKSNEVSNADMLAALVLIQSKMSDIEKSIADNAKIQQKNSQNLINNLAEQDKNISAIPVLTANIISDKINNAASRIDVSTNNIAVAAKALNESNSAFRVLIYAWVASMLIAFIIILYQLKIKKIADLKDKIKKLEIEVEALENDVQAAKEKEFNMLSKAFFNESEPNKKAEIEDKIKSLIMG